MLGGEHGRQTDRTVTDNRDGLAGRDLGGHGGEPAGTEDVGRRQQRRNQIGLGLTRCRNESAIRVRNAGLLGLGANRLGYELAIHALGLITGPANLASVVGDDERADDEVADLDVPHRVADLLDNPDVLVPHHLVVGRLDPPVRPQVRPADTGCGQPDDRVSGLDDLRVFAFLHSDIAGAIHDYATHQSSLLASAARPEPERSTVDT